MKHKAFGMSTFSLIIEDILDLVSYPDCVVWSFIKHIGNKVAHLLAHFQPVKAGEHIWDHGSPQRKKKVITIWLSKWKKQSKTSPKELMG